MKCLQLRFSMRIVLRIQLRIQPFLRSLCEYKTTKFELIYFKMSNEEEEVDIIGDFKTCILDNKPEK